MPLIYLDAGHGGRDSGAIGNGLLEKDLTLDLCERIKKGLSLYNNTEVIMSRDNDTYISLNERTRKANRSDADLLISVHINSFSSTSAKGFETFVYPEVKPETVALQNVLHAEIIRQIGGEVEDRGKKRKNLHMLRDSKMKSVLTENLFISNASDAKKLKDNDFLQRIAQGHINGIVKFLGLKKERDEIEPQPEPKGDKLFKVQTGAFKEKSNMEKMLADLIGDGYKPFVKFEDDLYKIQVAAFSEKSNAEKLEKELIDLGYKPFIVYE